MTSISEEWISTQYTAHKTHIISIEEECLLKNTYNNEQRFLFYGLNGYQYTIYIHISRNCKKNAIPKIKGYKI